jgi:apolipoprotein D and lipocalin family protein
VSCADVTATYTPLPDGRIRVVNRCRNLLDEGRERAAEGWARVADPSGAKLRVTFFWPFFGDYWVIGLDPEYRWSVVGAPGRDYLWILSRTPEMTAADYLHAVSIAREQGFPIERLVPTQRQEPHPAAAR